MPINVAEVIQEFVRNLMSDRTFAAQYAGDPNGMLAAQGVTDHDLSAVDMQAAVQAACADPSVPQEARSAVQSGYSGGGGPGSAAGHSQNVEQVIQHLNYVTYQTYEGDEYITNLIDNSVDVNVEGTVVGDVEVNAATGEGSQVIDGDNFGQANTGDGAVQTGGDASGVNTGVNTGTNAGANVEGSADGSTFNFGDGDATTVTGNTLEDGSAIATGSGDASGTDIDVEDNDTNVETNVVTAVQDNDTTINEDNDIAVNEDNDIAVVEDNDTAVSGGDTLAAQ